jgi:hypothetical protein
MEPERLLQLRLLSAIRATFLAHLILLDFITPIIFSEEYRPLSTSLYNFLRSYVTSFHLGPNNLLSNTLILRSSLSVSDHVSHKYKKTGKITFRFILTWIASWKTKGSTPKNSKHSYVLKVLIMAGIAILGIVKSSKFGSVYLRGGLTIPEARKNVNECDKFHF